MQAMYRIKREWIDTVKGERRVGFDFAPGKETNGIVSIAGFGRYNATTGVKIGGMRNSPLHSFSLAGIATISETKAYFGKDWQDEWAWDFIFTSDRPLAVDDIVIVDGLFGQHVVLSASSSKAQVVGDTKKPFTVLSSKCSFLSVR